MHIKPFTCYIYFPADVVGNITVERIWFGNEDAVAIIHEEAITTHGHGDGCREVRIRVPGESISTTFASGVFFLGSREILEQDSYSPQEESSNSWTKKIVHRVDGTKNNVRKLLDKTNNLVVRFHPFPSSFLFSHRITQSEFVFCPKPIFEVQVSDFVG